MLVVLDVLDDLTELDVLDIQLELDVAKLPRVDPSVRYPDPEEDMEVLVEDRYAERVEEFEYGDDPVPCHVVFDPCPLRVPEFVPLCLWVGATDPIQLRPSR